MTDNLQTAIAKQLSNSNVGLFRAQLLGKISPALHEGDANKISTALNAMLKAGHVSKSTRIGLDGSRWSLTPQGRAAYSVLHDGEEQDDRGYTNRLLSDAMAAPADDNATIEPATELPVKTDPAAQSLLLDPAYEIDALIITLVNKIHDSAGPMIERKAEKIQLLEVLENFPLLPGAAKSLLFDIRMDLEKLEMA